MSRGFLEAYRDASVALLEALERGEWQRAWRLLRQRERLRKRWKGALDGSNPELAELLVKDARCRELLAARIGSIRRELAEIRGFKRWRLSQTYAIGRESRYIDAEG